MHVLSFTILTAFLFLTIGCTQGKGLVEMTQNSPVEVAPVPIYDPTATVTESCSPAQISVSVTPSVQAATVGQEVLWRVQASGCTGAYRLFVGGVAIKNFNGSTSFSKSYSSAGSIAETVRIESINSTNQVLATETRIASITIENSAPAFSCRMEYRSDLSQTVEVDSQYRFTRGLPQFAFEAYPSQPARLISVQSVQGTATPSIAIPSGEVSGSQSFSIGLNSVGENFILATFQTTTTPAQTAACFLRVEVRTTMAPPPPVIIYPPSVSLTVNGGSTTTIGSGGSVTLRWSSGNVRSCSLTDSLGTSISSLLSAEVGFEVTSIPSSRSFTIQCLGFDTTAPPVRATVSVVVSDPDSYLIFVSSQKYNGAFSFGGLSGRAAADAICASLVQSSSQLGGWKSRPWKAMVNVAGQANTGQRYMTDVIATTKAVYNNRASGREMMVGAGQLFSTTPSAPANYDENGQSVPTSEGANVWTGAANNAGLVFAPSGKGTGGTPTCGNWSNSGYTGFMGASSDVNTWLANRYYSCGVMNRIYCISQ